MCEYVYMYACDFGCPPDLVSKSLSPCEFLARLQELCLHGSQCLLSAQASWLCQVRMTASGCKRICMYVFMYVCKYVCKYVCMYVSKFVCNFSYPNLNYLNTSVNHTTCRHK